MKLFRRYTSNHSKVFRCFSLALIASLLGACGQPDSSANKSPLSHAPTDTLQRGEYLARAGNCVGCHTPLGKEPYSGGRAIPTPFGDVISSNLTPDPETGLGNWSNEDFWQALHHGKSRDGRSLYPAFPYPSYSLVTRDDSDALFSYLQSIPAIKQAVPAHQLRFPYNSQWALQAWRALYFSPAQFTVDNEQSESWNRGAYLVKGLGHCAACHTPRGTLGNYDNSKPLSGAHIEGLGWDAPTLATGQLNEQQQDELVRLLKSGINKRDVLSGPMAEVVGHSLQYLATEDIEAMVEYLSSLPATTQKSNKSKQPREEQLKLGQAVYQEHCSDCHGDNGQGQAYRYPALAGNQTVTATSPNNAIQSLMFGGFGASTVDRPRPHGMPAFAQQLSDREAAAVLSYIRSSWGNYAPAVRASAMRQH